MFLDKQPTGSYSFKCFAHHTAIFKSLSKKKKRQKRRREWALKLWALGIEQSETS